VRQESLFYILNDKGLFEPHEPDYEGVYGSLVLPKMKLSADIFWHDPLPRGPEIAQLVEEMLKS
jgi:hypothetical protein